MQSAEWKKVLISYASDRGQCLEYTKNLKRINKQNLNIKKTNNPIGKWGIELKRAFSKDKIQMAEKHGLNIQHP